MSTEIAKRPDPVRQVIKWIVEGQSEADISDAIAATFPDAKSRPLIAKALDELAKQGTADVELIRGFALEATREIYRKAVEIGDHQTALRAIRQLVELAAK